MIENCPKCTAPSPNGTSCPRCGLIFANWKPERAPLPMAPLGAAAPRRRRMPPLAITAGVGGLLLLVVLIRVCSSDPDPDAGPEVALQEPGLEEEAPEDGPAIEGEAPAGGVPTASWELPSPEPTVDAGELPAALERGSVSVSWFTGAEGWQRATDEQADNLAPLLALVSSGSCPACIRLETEVLPAIEGGLREVVKVRIVPAGSPEEQAVATRLGGGDGALWLTPFPGASAVRLSFGSAEAPEVLVERLQGELRRAASSRLSQAKPLRQNGELAAALRLLHEAVVLDPELYEAYSVRGLVYERAGDPARAITELQTALSRGTDLPEAREKLALLYLQADRNDDALSILDPLLRLAPRHGKGRAHWLRAITWQRKNDEEKAWNDVREACNLGHSRACRMLKK